MAPKTVLFVAVSGATVILDQLTKYLVSHNLRLQRDAIDVIPGWLQVVHVRNSGAAFGLLNDFDYRMWVFLAFTLIAIGVIIQLFRQLPSGDRFMSLTLGLILAGAVGNGIDRLLKQSVTDFIRVYTEAPALKSWLIAHFGTNEYPSFNVADSAIVVGVALFLVHYVFLEDRAARDELPLDPEDIPAQDAG